MVRFDVIYAAWLKVAKEESFRNRWLFDEVWYQAIRKAFPDLANDPEFDRAKMNRAITRNDKNLNNFEETNTSGRFRRCVYCKDPFGAAKRDATLYYVTDPGTRVERPPEGDTSFFQSQDVNVPVIHRTEKAAKATTKDQPSRNDSTKPTSSMFLKVDYFDSPECKKLFLGDTKSELSVRKVLQQRIDRLQRVNRFPKGWKDMVENHDKDNTCSSYDIFIVKQRSQLLCLAYILALEHMPRQNWAKCCQKACAELNRLGNEAATSGGTVAQWNATLRSNKERFGLTLRAGGKNSDGNTKPAKKQRKNEKESATDTKVSL